MFFFNFVQSYFLASGKQFHVAFATLMFTVFPRLSLGLFASATIIKVYASLFQVPRWKCAAKIVKNDTKNTRTAPFSRSWRLIFAWLVFTTSRISESLSQAMFNLAQGFLSLKLFRNL